MYETLKDFLIDDFWIMPATPKYIDKGVPYITSKNIKNGKLDYNNINYISKEDYENISKNRPIKVNDILISMIGTIGETAVVTESDSEFYGQNMFLVRLNDKKLDQRFFLNYFKSSFVKNQLFNKQNKSTQSYLKANHIEDLKVPVISIKEQIKIADKLDKIQMMIDEKKEQISLLNQLIKSQFIEMFEKDNNFEKIIVSQAIEKHYIEKPSDGNHGSKHPKSSDYVESGVPFIMANNLKNGYVDLVNCNFITKQQAESLDKGFAKDGDVLITHKGTIGETAILHTNYEYVMLTPQITYYRTNDKYILPEYLKAYFDSDLFQLNIKKIASAGSTRSYIGITEQRKLSLIVPPMELQKKYSDFVKQIDKQKFEVKKSLKKLEELQASLMQEYFG